MEEPETGPPHAIRFIEAAANGSTVLIRRDGGLPCEQLVVEPIAQRVRWRLLDEPEGGGLAWTVMLSPTDRAIVTWCADRPNAPYQLRRADGSIVDLPGFTGGCWSADGSWFGGPEGAFSAQGERISDPLMLRDQHLEMLFHPGPDPHTLRFVDGGRVYEWDGRSPPVLLQDWPWTSSHRDRILDLPYARPVRMSPGGSYLAWFDRARVDGIWIADAQADEAFEVEETVDAMAWSDDTTLWILSDGQVLGFHVEEGRIQELRLPELQGRVTALGASQAPPVLYIGTSLGEVAQFAL